MSCIYWSGEICLAQPRTIKKVRLYKPPDSHVKKFCEASEYSVCPRYVNYVTHLKRTKDKADEVKP